MVQEQQLGGIISVLSRWRGRLATRRKLLDAARKRHEWLHNAQTRALLAKRKAQVAYAERVVKRHTPHSQSHGVSNRGVTMIAVYEGFVDHAYKPVAAERYWTIGYGHYGADVRPGQHITRAQGIALLHRDLNERYAPPVLALKLPRQAMTDAIVDAVYNLGPGILDRSHTLGAALHARNWTAAANALLMYDKDATGRRNPVLSARRRAERALFLSR